MAIVSNGPVALTRGVPLTIFTAGAPDLPGVFSGKLTPQSIPLAGDTVLVEMLGQTTGRVGQDVEIIKVMSFTDTNFYLTPLKATLFYALRVTLENSSPSASMNLDYEVDREVSL